MATRLPGGKKSASIQRPRHERPYGCAPTPCPRNPRPAERITKRSQASAGMTTFPADRSKSTQCAEEHGLRLPKTESGKRRCRRNASRCGLTVLTAPAIAGPFVRFLKRVNHSVVQRRLADWDERRTSYPRRSTKPNFPHRCPTNASSNARSPPECRRCLCWQWWRRLSVNSTSTMFLPAITRCGAILKSIIVADCLLLRTNHIFTNKH